MVYQYMLPITILEIIHRPVFYLKHDVSETGFCLSLQVNTTQLGSIDTASLCLRNFCFKYEYKKGRWIMPRNVNVIGHIHFFWPHSATSKHVRERTVSTEPPPLVGVAWSSQPIPTAVFSVSRPEPLTFSFKQLPNWTHEIKWTPFQTHYFSENLVTQGIEPENSGSLQRNIWK
jgi:hypothetical protein